MSGKSGSVGVVGGGACTLWRRLPQLRAVRTRLPLRPLSGCCSGRSSHTPGRHQELRGNTRARSLQACGPASTSQTPWLRKTTSPAGPALEINNGHQCLKHKFWSASFQAQVACCVACEGYVAATPVAWRAGRYVKACEAAGPTVKRGVGNAKTHYIWCCEGIQATTASVRRVSRPRPVDPRQTAGPGRWWPVGASSRASPAPPSAW